MVFKKIVNFLCCFIVSIRDFIKKLRYLKSKISTKFHRLLFPFYFFNIFGILFSISRTQTCTKIVEFFVVFYWKGWRFYQRFLENSAVYYLFFYFVIIFDILFSISSIYTFKKNLENLIYFYFMD